MGAAYFPRRPLTDKRLHGAIVPANAYQRTKFQLPIALIVSEIKRVSQNLMWGYYFPAVPGTVKLLCVLQVLDKIKQPAKFQHRIMQLYFL